MKHFISAAAALALTPSFAHASGGGQLPWNQPLSTLAQNLTGPTAGAIAIIATIAAIVMFVRSGGEMGGLFMGVAGVAVIAALICGVPLFFSGLGITATAAVLF